MSELQDMLQGTRGFGTFSWKALHSATGFQGTVYRLEHLRNQNQGLSSATCVHSVWGAPRTSNDQQVLV